MLMENSYIENKKDYMKHYIREHMNIYDSEDMKYINEYHKYKNNIEMFSFFIGLDTDTIKELDKPLSYEKVIILSDWRRDSLGQNYYTIYKKPLKDYITIRDILEQLKTDNECKELLYNETNDYHILTDILKKTNIQYDMYFEDL